MNLTQGSIDGTDILPHDNAIYRAHLCASTGLSIYTPLSLLQFSQFQFYPSLFTLFANDPFDDRKVIGDPYCTVFVGRLSRYTSEDTLREAMSEYGQVKNLHLVRHIGFIDPNHQ
ncbi:hypothetical protein RGQ29_007076 [Quercus rubra]|uniref:RRM domain-containing protein n=1 Tax=Quercus rubra TaxID=3512 RepID=A0AAN7DWK1_QUERU|nr:hypothetical protein RGQ29_007076 [Quercus rubra]